MVCLWFYLVCCSHTRGSSNCIGTFVSIGCLGILRQISIARTKSYRTSVCLVLNNSRPQLPLYFGLASFHTHLLELQCCWSHIEEHGMTQPSTANTKATYRQFPNPSYASATLSWVSRAWATHVGIPGSSTPMRSCLSPKTPTTPTSTPETR